jgi:hypothetical protein
MTHNQIENICIGWIQEKALTYGYVLSVTETDPGDNESPINCYIPSILNEDLPRHMFNSDVEDLWRHIFRMIEKRGGPLE